MEKHNTRSAAKTRAKIIAAAREAFSQYGYPNVGIRDVANLAGVNNALVARYFGSKAGLFEATLIDAINTRLAGMDEKNDFIDSVIANLLTLHHDAGGMVLLSAGDPVVRDIIIRVTNTQVIPGLAALIGPPNAKERSLQLVMIACGFVFATHLLPVGPPESKITREWLRASVKEIIQDRKLPVSGSTRSITAGPERVSESSGGRGSPARQRSVRKRD